MMNGFAKPVALAVLCAAIVFAAAATAEEGAPKTGEPHYQLIGIDSSSSPSIAYVVAGREEQAQETRTEDFHWEGFSEGIGSELQSVEIKFNEEVYSIPMEEEDPPIGPCTMEQDMFCFEACFAQTYPKLTKNLGTCHEVTITIMYGCSASGTKVSCHCMGGSARGTNCYVTNPTSFQRA